MTCKRLFIALSLVLLLAPLFGEQLTYSQTIQLRGILNQYEANEIELSQQLRVLNINLENLYRESANLKKQTGELKTSLTASRLQVESLNLALEDMGQSIASLETSLKNMERKNNILKYGLAGAVAVAVVEGIILIIGQ